MGRTATEGQLHLDDRISHAPLDCFLEHILRCQMIDNIHADSIGMR